MGHNTIQLRSLLVTGAATVALSLGSAMLWQLPHVGSTLIATAQAAETHEGSGESGHAGAGKGRMGGQSSGEEGMGHGGGTSGSHSVEQSVLRGHGQGGSQGGHGAEAGRTGGTGASQSVEENVLRGHGGSSASGESEAEESEGRGPKYGGGKSPGKPAGAGSKKGDLYGDLYVILRDANGVPILDQYGHVQPIDALGNLIPLTPEGEIEPGYEALAQAVEFSRLSVSRSPSKVLDKAYDEAISAINSATAIGVDSSGRLVLKIDGEDKTIDSPLENLALYKALMNNGYLPNLNLQDGVSLGSLSYLADSSMSQSDILQAASFLAAAADKYGVITKDMVVYNNSILGVVGVNPITVDGKTYVNFDGVSYDRQSTYSGDVTYVKANPDGTFTKVTESIMDAVFDGKDASATQLEAFTQAADDARAVIEFVHDHPIPAE